MIRNIVLTSLLAVSASAVQARPDRASPAAAVPSPARIGAMAAAAYLARPDIVPLRTSVARGVHYADVASGYGAARLAEAIGDKALLARVIARERVASGFENSANHVDVSVYGTWPLEIARQTGDKDALRRGLALADNQWTTLGQDGLTTQADNVAHYLNRPRATGDLHGQAALLWFAAELVAPPQIRTTDKLRASS